MEESKTSRTVKKRFSSLPYSLNRLYRQISTTKPSTFILSAIAIGFAIFLFGGGLYNLIVRPYPAIYVGRFVFVNPQLSEQIIAESIIAMTLYSFGTAGLLVIYQSAKYAYKPRQAYMMFIIGIGLLMLAYVFLEYVMHIWKGV